LAAWPLCLRRKEWHKQIILVLIGVFQLTEGPFLRFLAGRGLRSPGGETLSVIIKLLWPRS